MQDFSPPKNDTTKNFKGPYITLKKLSLRLVFKRAKVAQQSSEMKLQRLPESHFEVQNMLPQESK